MVGGSTVRGISGGGRKRLCIGNDILVNPSLLFLAEPTSGLDSTTTLKIIQVLLNLAKVCCVIHHDSLIHNYPRP